MSFANANSAAVLRSRAKTKRVELLLKPDEYREIEAAAKGAPIASFIKSKIRESMNNKAPECSGFCHKVVAAGSCTVCGALLEPGRLFLCRQCEKKQKKEKGEA